MSKSHITTHVLDTANGVAAKDVNVTLSILQDDQWEQISTESTNSDGRCISLFSAQGTPKPLVPGTFKLHFDIGTYFGNLGSECFFPFAEVFVNNLGCLQDIWSTQQALSCSVGHYSVCLQHISWNLRIDDLLIKRCPDVHKKFVQNNVDLSIVTTGWLVCLYFNSLPVEVKKKKKKKKFFFFHFFFID